MNFYHKSILCDYNICYLFQAYDTISAEVNHPPRPPDHAM